MYLACQVGWISGERLESATSEYSESGSSLLPRQTEPFYGGKLNRGFLADASRDPLDPVVSRKEAATSSSLSVYIIGIIYLDPERGCHFLVIFRIIWSRSFLSQVISLWHDAKLNDANLPSNPQKICAINQNESCTEDPHFCESPLEMFLFCE